MLDSWMADTRWLRAVQSRAAAVLYHAGIGADRVTAAAAIVGVMSGLAFAAGRTVVGLGALWINAALDAVDGTIARHHERPTTLGGILDLAADRTVEAAALLGIAWHRPALGFAALTVLASWYVNITVFLAVGSVMPAGEKLIVYPPGLLERTEAFVFLTLLVLLGNAGVYLCYAYAAAEVWTAIQRFNFARRQLR